MSSTSDSLSVEAQDRVGEQSPTEMQYSDHPRFFFVDDTLQFTVENTNYSIHRYLLATHAPTWLNELNQMSKPIVLTDVRTNEVDALLSIIYPSDVRKYDIGTADEWSSVLRLATRWYFRSLRELAIEQLEPLASTSQKFLLARELDIPKWLLPSLTALCLRKDPLSLAEAERLAMADVVLIFTTRELIKDRQLPANADAISKHIELALDPNSTHTKAGIETQTETPSPNKAKNKSRARARKPQTMDQSPKVEDGPCDPTVISDALREYQYDRAISAIGAEDHEDAIREINKWTHSGLGNLGENAVRELAWAIIRRSARDSTFSQSAVHVLSSWKRDNVRFQSTIDAVLQDAVYNGILPQMYEQAHCNPSTAIGRVIYGPRERWLDDDEFKVRCDNSLAFVTEIARAALLPRDAICDRLPAAGESASILYKYLILLGPVLDLPDLKDRFEQRLRTCDDSIWQAKWNNDPVKRKIHRSWMQKIYHLRERNWIPED